MRGKLKIRYIILIVLLSVVWATQLIPSLGEVYAQSVYPVISHILSSFSKLIPFAVGDLFIFLSIIVRYFFASGSAYIVAMLPVFAMLANVSGAPLMLTALALLFSNSYGGMVTHYGGAAGPVIFGVGYNDIKSAVTYADEPAVPKFQAEGLVFREWRSLCWAHYYAAMAAVHLGERAIPTAEELIAELPPLVFPA